MGNNYSSENIFLAMLLFLLLNNALGLPGISDDKGITGTWTAGNSSNKLQTDGNSYSCDDFCYALWEDCVSSGEHFWRIRFEDKIFLQAIELANKEKFAEEFGFGDNYRQRIEPGSTVEILASFSDGKGYFGYNNQPLRQVLELEATPQSKVCPAIRYFGSGRVNIVKETDIPSQADRKDLRDIAEMEGQWYVFPENIKIGEETLSSKNFSDNFLKKNSHNSLATLSIAKVSNSTIGLYKIRVGVINSIVMKIRMYEDLWKTVTSPVTTLIGGPPERLNLENQMSSLIQNPNSVKIVAGNLIIQKNHMMVTFVR